MNNNIPDRKAIEAAVEFFTNELKYSTIEKKYNDSLHEDFQQKLPYWNESVRCHNTILDLAALYLSASEKMPVIERFVYSGSIEFTEHYNRMEELLKLCTISHMKSMAEKDKTIETLKAEVQILCSQRMDNQAEIARLKIERVGLIREKDAEIARLRKIVDGITMSKICIVIDNFQKHRQIGNANLAETIVKSIKEE